MEGPIIPPETLRAAIATLAPDRQRVYILVAREGLSIVTVSEIMQLPRIEVEHLLAHALVDLIYALDP
jgi:DNA-directed RNA polymerase specialized sigma24 family protein